MHYGTAAPKFVTQGGNSVLLNHARILSDYPEYDNNEQPSVVNGYINHIHNGYHWVYAIRIFVYKESESIAKSNELLPFLGSDVFLYRHREAYPFKDKDGNNVLFRVKEVTPGYLNTPDYKDVIDIVFKSTNYIDVRKSILPVNVRINNDGTVRVNNDGTFQYG